MSNLSANHLLIVINGKVDSCMGIHFRVIQSIVNFYFLSHFLWLQFRHQLSSNDPVRDHVLKLMLEIKLKGISGYFTIIVILSRTLSL